MPSASSSASPLGPSLSFLFEVTEPVVTRALTGIKESYINPGAVIEHDGVLHMFANVFTAWPGRVSMPHLTSTDGRTWALAAPEPILTSDDVPFANPGADISTGFVTADGTWVLIFESVNLGRPWAIGLVRGPGPDGPWTVHPEPILEAGAAGGFDAAGLSWPSVVPTGDGFAMYYTALNEPRGTGVIARATSSDGQTWTKDDAPVLAAELPWERRKLDRPRVVVTPQGLAMVYAGGRLTDRGLAWSDDGVSWRRDGEQPVIDQGDFPIRGQAWDAALLYRDGALHYYLEIGSASGSTASTEVYLATADMP